MLLLVPTSRNKDWAHIGYIPVGHRGLVLEIFASVLSIYQVFQAPTGCRLCVYVSI